MRIKRRKKDRNDPEPPHWHASQKRAIEARRRDRSLYKANQTIVVVSHRIF